MTLTGFLIQTIHCLVALAWPRPLRFWRKRSTSGVIMLSEGGVRLLPSPSAAWLNGYATLLATMEGHWISDTATVQVIERQGMQPLYVAGVPGRSASFYSVDELMDWLQSQGVESADPIWEYIEQLIEHGY